MATDLGERVRQRMNDAGIGDKFKWKIYEEGGPANQVVAKLKPKGQLGSDENLSIVHIPKAELTDQTALGRRVDQLVTDAQLVSDRWLRDSRRTMGEFARGYRRLTALFESIGHRVEEDFGLDVRDRSEAERAAIGTRASDRTGLPGQGLSGLPDRPAATAEGATAASETDSGKAAAGTGPSAAEQGAQSGTDTVTGASQGGQEWPSGVGGGDAAKPSERPATTT